jgi:uncharacterized metal-binding protein YceD (DUF177 family)
MARSWPARHWVLGPLDFRAPTLYLSKLMGLVLMVPTMNVPAQRWNVPVRFEDVPEAGLRIDLVADASVRAVLARAAGVEAVPRIEANFDVTRHGRDGLQVRGRVSATVRQACVVTLEPVENEIDEPVDLTFMPPQDGGDVHRREEELGPHDPPEALVNGMVDLGAIAAEFLILGIDPYPRKAGAVFASPAAGDASDHPFAALAALKKR